MPVHDFFGCVRADGFRRFENYPLRYYDSELLTSCEYFRKFEWLQIPFSEDIKYVFEPRKWIPPLSHKTCIIREIVDEKDWWGGFSFLDNKIK